MDVKSAMFSQAVTANSILGHEKHKLLFKKLIWILQVNCLHTYVFKKRIISPYANWLPGKQTNERNWLVLRIAREIDIRVLVFV